VADPKRMASILNFAIDPGTGAWNSTDPDKLAQRIVNVVQVYTRDQLLKLPLEDALRQAAPIAAGVLSTVRAEASLAGMGVEVVGLYFTAIKPTPEMAKALEAEYREGLQVKADQAIYNRRALAVEQERRIKENELNTQTALEERRLELVDLQGQNDLKAAEYEARASETRLAPYLAAEPRSLLALGLRDLGKNAAKIGNLTITPDILGSLLAAKE
jgi:regulator of protease activity HflC (stomatin/prohibitin superfamily)